MQRRLPNLRWGLALILFFASVLNYLDRQALSILAPTIQKDLHLTDARYAAINNLFLIAYTASYLFSGRLVERWGIRRSMTLFVGWWSVANMLTGLARAFGGLGICRALLGLGEAGNYTVGPKVVSEWFPPRERGVAIGLYSMGAAIGATIAPPIILWLAYSRSWQTAFVVTGALGFVWLLPWLIFYYPPATHPHLTAEQREAVTEAASEATTEGAPAVAGDVPVRNAYLTILSRKDVWALTLARLLTDPAWYFYQSWLAKYLHSDRGLPQEKLGITWVVFLAADAGTLIGGILSGWLIRSGRTPPAARMTVMAVCACLMPLSPLVALAPSVPLCLAVAMLMVFSHLTWLINLSALVVDRLPKSIVATAFGVIAAGSTVGGILMNSFVGWLVTNHSYTDWFIVMAFLHPVAWLLLRVFGVHRAPTADERTSGISAAATKAAA